MTNNEHGSRPISRREFLKFALLWGAAALTGCTQQSQPEGFQAVYGEGGKVVGYVDKNNVFHPITPQVGNDNTPPSTTTATETPTKPKEAATATAETSPSISPSFSAINIPDNVAAENIDTAVDNFKNTIGLGSEGWIAEPGKLLVGPDFPQDIINQAGGAIERISPVNQQVFENEGPSYFNLPEGGFILGTTAGVKITVREVVIKLNPQEGHNWMFVLRGLYADGKQDSDRNIRVRFEDYVAGHIQVMRYPGKPNGGFISERQFKQIAEVSHTEETNCGAEGCSRLSVFFYDVNTGAAAVITQNGLNGPWEPVWANFKTRK